MKQDNLNGVLTKYKKNDLMVKKKMIKSFANGGYTVEKLM